MKCHNLLKTKKEFQHLPFVLNILMVWKRLKEEKTHIFLYAYIQLTLHALTDTAQIQDDPPPADSISSLRGLS